VKHLEVKIGSDGKIEAKAKNLGLLRKEKGWNPTKVKTIVVEFHGKVSSKYKYPISPRDLIKEIVVRVEEE